MQSVVYAECHLCRVSYMLIVSFIVMLSVTFMLCGVSYMLIVSFFAIPSVLYVECHIFIVMLNVIYSGGHILLRFESHFADCHYADCLYPLCLSC